MEITMRHILLYLSVKYAGDFNSMYDAIKRKELIDKDDVEKVLKSVKSKYITLLDKEYPLSLKHIGTPPLVLYYYGDIKLLNNPNIIAIIGARKCSEYGKEMTKRIVAGLTKYEATILSGGALGIDGIAHTIALENHQKTILVSASGIDNPYPKTHTELYERIKKEGLIISEYPGMIEPQPTFFLIRNRIIAALSERIVVTEAKVRSGTINTVAYGLEFGKDICCVPSNANLNSGCNMLIKQGAKLIEKANDIYADYWWKQKKRNSTIEAFNV